MWISFTVDIRFIPTDLAAEKQMVFPVKLKLPEEMSENETTAVIGILKKWLFNRFVVYCQRSPMNNSIVDLVAAFIYFRIF